MRFGKAPPLILMGLVLALCTFLPACTSTQDGTALLAASQARKAEFDGMADAFEAIARRSTSDPAIIGRIVDELNRARNDYGRMTVASEMLIQQLLSVDYERLLPAIEDVLNRGLDRAGYPAYRPPADPDPEPEARVTPRRVPNAEPEERSPGDRPAAVARGREGFPEAVELFLASLENPEGPSAAELVAKRSP